MSITQPVIAWVRFIVEAESWIRPVKGAAVNNNTAKGHSVSAHPFGQRVDNNIRSMLKGPEQAGRGKGGVHHQRQMMFFGNGADCCNIRHLKAGVANGFTVKHSGFFRDRLFKIGRIGGIDQMNLDAQLRKNGIKLGIGAAVEVVGRNHLITVSTDVDDGIKNCRCTGGKGQGCSTAFQGCYPLFQNILGWIHQPRIDVAQFFEAEQVGGMLSIFKKVRTGSVDRHATGKCCIIYGVSGMQSQSFKV